MKATIGFIFFTLFFASKTLSQKNSIQIYSLQEFTRYRCQITLSTDVEFDTTKKMSGLFDFRIDCAAFENLIIITRKSECDTLPPNLLKDPFVVEVKRKSLIKFFYFTEINCFKSFLRKLEELFSEDSQKLRVREAIDFFVYKYHLE